MAFNPQKTVKGCVALTLVKYFLATQCEVLRVRQRTKGTCLLWAGGTESKDQTREDYVMVLKKFQNLNNKIHLVHIHMYIVSKNDWENIEYEEKNLIIPFLHLQTSTCYSF